MEWRTSKRVLDLTKSGVVMGILNVTPDSFSDGGHHQAIDRALDHARRMIAEGAEIIDIGGESTRPGSNEVSAGLEIERTIPVIRELRAEWGGSISIDTWKASVAAAALDAGADIVNDISGLTGDSDMTEVCRDAHCGIVVMHMQGSPKTMQVAPHYTDVVREVRDFFGERLDTLVRAGIAEECLCFDPGIGFGKNLEHNVELLRNLGDLAPEDLPLLLGVSRKSFIGKLLDSDRLEDREWPTVALTARAREQGVRIHRVHQIRPNVEALRMIEAILHGV